MRLALTRALGLGIAGLLVALFASCHSSDREVHWCTNFGKHPSGTCRSGLTVIVHDAPHPELAEFWLRVRRVELLQGRRALEVWSGDCDLDLLQYRMVGRLLAVRSDLPADRFDAIRITLEDPSALDHAALPLTLAGGASEAGRYVVEARLAEALWLSTDLQRVVLIDIDVEASLRVALDGLRFEPVVSARTLEANEPAFPIEGQPALVTGVAPDGSWLDLAGSFGNVEARTREAVIGLAPEAPPAPAAPGIALRPGDEILIRTGRMHASGLFEAEWILPR